LIRKSFYNCRHEVPPVPHIFDRLRTIQERHGYLPAEQLKALSKSADIPLYQIHGVADFYPHFHLKPRPKVTVQVCSDLPCHLRGAATLRRDLETRCGAFKKQGVAIGGVSCLGQCDGAPAVSINDHIHRDVSAAQAEAWVRAALDGKAAPVDDAVSRVTSLEADPYPGSRPYGALRKLLKSRDWDGVIAEIKASGLGGRGGAGFPTGVKWEAVRNAAGEEKYVICNADESEPGTIKDRFILDHLPHLVVEGMIIAGLATGARHGIVFIRHEYAAQRRRLEEELFRASAEGLLGAATVGFDLEIFVSPGGYICGEATALLEAIEGKRAEPRNKPPLPVTHGLWNRPTVLNNVETFAMIPRILVNGGEAGMKFVAVSGDVCRPGVFLIPMGLPFADAIFHHAGGIRDGKKLKAFAPSGPSSGFLPASMADVGIDLKSLAAAGSMLGSSGIVVCAEGTCVLDAALNATAFFRNESCGKCVPCRIGTQELVNVFSLWSQGKGTPADLQLVDELSDALKLTSLCGLGQFAAAPIISALQHFHQEIVEHIVSHRCPEGVCPMHEARA
jgi:NADH:ubiquinone oxidoreductase subunit F (NADH-binding)/NADH:ubiquinone oxidoreductase subunit E